MKYNYNFIFRDKIFKNEKEKINEVNRNIELEINDFDSETEIVFIEPETAKDDLAVIFEKIDKNFRRIVLNKKDWSINNLKEIINNWSVLKREIIFNLNDENSDNVVEFILELSKYYENEEYLSFLLKNYNIIPFFRIFDFKYPKDLEKSTITLFNLLSDGEITFDIKTKTKKEVRNEINVFIEGKEDKKFDLISLKQKIRADYNVTSGYPLGIKINLSGTYKIIDDILDSLKVIIFIEAEKIMQKSIEINISKKED